VPLLFTQEDKANSQEMKGFSKGEFRYNGEGSILYWNYYSGQNLGLILKI